MTTRKPEMKGILDLDRSQANRKGPRKGVNFRATAALLLALAFFAAFVVGVLNLGTLSEQYPAMLPVQPFLFPLAAMTMLVTVIPLVFYLSFQEDFGDLNPLIPSHYVYLVKKTIQAIRTNDFKVSAKDF